jgi:hypothetical protein
MARSTNYYFLIDNLDVNNADLMRKSLKTIPEIKRVALNAGQRLIEIEATADIEAQVKLACDVAGVQFRRKVKNREF